MKERPILFSAPMVLALLAGTKTQTRRVVKPQPDNPETFGVSPIWGRGVLREALDPQQRFHVHAAFNEGGKRVDRWLPCPFGAPGDRLWVRETFRSWDVGCQEDHADDETCEPHCNQTYVAYAATPREGYRPKPDKARITYLHESSPIDSDPKLLGPWKPSIFMPRWASRISLEVTGVRVERLLDISEGDAQAEGIEDRGRDGWAWPTAPVESIWGMARDAYFSGWDWLNGKGTAAKNPWVWIVEFKRVANG